MINFNPAYLKVIATIDPASITGAEVFSDVIDMTIWDSILAVFATGDIAGGTIDFKAYQCDNAGNNAVEIKAATQLADEAVVNDIGQIVMALRSAEVLAVSGEHTYAKFGVTIGAAGGPACVLVLGMQATKIESAADLASVVEIKS